MTFGAVGLISFVAWGISAPSAISPKHETSEGIVYYYGEECSHCKDLAKFFEENKISEKVSFVKKEVWHNTKNSREMNDRAKECGLSKEEEGVPLVWSDEKCFVGGPEAEKFFKEKAGIQ